ncbi:HNH endonuclease [Saliphagus infecundisoli]|uniref:HNH endonuclease n=1 Tax=Saliphagus infecundisoli TaxID=1849069 RepID=A0ABD5QCD5_9EURY|nr:HNH endonuclease signature motif containing protein [Saliphagus infecundisoli]
MYASHAGHTTAPYNTAYLRDDRSQLYGEFGIDREGDRLEDAPADFAARREALLAFYGGRCGRCLAGIGTTHTEEDDLAYVHPLPTPGEMPASMTADGGQRQRWALENLVPLCEPCYGLCSVEEPGRIDSFGGAARDAQQFPQWAGDPRVAVERVPLTGRELWLRNRLRERHGEGGGAESINEPVALAACLARETPADLAVALGEAFAADAWQPIPEAQRLTDRWEALPADDRERYERRVARRRERIEA